MIQHDILRNPEQPKEEDDEKKKTKNLFTAEKYKEYDPKALRRNADQWRMKERVWVLISSLFSLFIILLH